MQTFLVSLIVFGIIIFVHEFGHFILAKLSGIRVEEFSLGMGPQVVGHKKGETLYSLRALPLGGFCKMTGEMMVDDDAPPDPRNFNEKSLWARMAVVVSGSLMNFLLGAMIFALMFSVIGVPKDYANFVGDVLPGSAAEIVGIQANDEILSINGKPLKSWSEITGIIHHSTEEKLEVELKRNQQIFKVTVIPQYDPERQVGLIGIVPRDPLWERMGLFAGIGKGFTQTYELTVGMLQQLGLLISGQVSADGVTGPVGIIQLIGESARFGWVNVAYLTALISINLGLINLLPIPALDGGRLFFLLIEAVRGGKKVKPEKENLIHFLGFALLMALMLFITYKDILRLFTGF
ncbi:MAG: RIP metalloprotease RseP [Clostridia bacterium]|nr:RIP metalloprotease RseP [Clostridia bacterium]MDD4145560.1 RIP metalloprotease RseP [Clostridia bacterium]MDD4664964.1 RIP metalloprotease RseP [Clostridia bacterium]